MARPLLRPGLLDGLVVAVASPPASGGGRFAPAVAAASAALGAQVHEVAIDPFGDPPEPPADADQLVWDGAGAFAAAGEGDPSVEAVRAVLDGAWLAVRALAPERATKVVLIAPPPGGAHAAAARAGLENLVRTLSVEWARYGVRTAAIHPGAATEPATVAELCAFLASPAGDYHSGSLIALGGAAGGAP